ncbi:site-specific integrase [Peribacillus sp. AS_2]|uniref:site-specific integrase n=1 Tax=Peribacillus sp. AS_2 TaxID=2996755 RepID=UPI0022A7081D|nr:site-specific integrase [Peribacillus sp. AS_2]MCZ0871246.1 site-specific integrase [Peribacillus sp. AS_2]
MGLGRYKFVVRETLIEDLLGNNRLENKRVINIGVQDIVTGIIVPHPITHFIRSTYEYKGVSLSAQINPAREIVKFFNFIYEQIGLQESEFLNLPKKGIRGLQLIHGARFITHQTHKKLSRNYVLQIERYLTHFFEYLTKMELIDEEIEFDSFVNRKQEEIMISPFRHPRLDTNYPSTSEPIKDKLKDFGTENKERLIWEFLEEARRVSPEIAFGIALQIFGGLRRGEVVNLTSASLPTDFLSNSNFVLVQDNQHLLFNHIKDTKKEQVKRNRIQAILPSSYLKEIYNSHMKMNEKVKKSNPFAFFVDDKGRTITGGTFEKKFAKVKYAYIDRLAATPGRYLDFKRLSEPVWGTHIGRGIFTNFLAEKGLDEKRLAIARGDKSTKSAKDYIDNRNAIANFQTAMEAFSTQEILDVSNHLESKWNEEVFTGGAKY